MSHPSSLVHSKINSAHVQTILGNILSFCLRSKQLLTKCEFLTLPFESLLHIHFAFTYQSLILCLYSCWIVQYSLPYNNVGLYNCFIKVAFQLLRQVLITLDPWSLSPFRLVCLHFNYFIPISPKYFRASIGISSSLLALLALIFFKASWIIYPLILHMKCG